MPKPRGSRGVPTLSLTVLGCSLCNLGVGNLLGWFDQQLKADKAKGWDCPILVFVHIPLLQYDTMIADGKAAGGFKNEKVCFDSDTGDTFKVFAAGKRVKGVFCGYDHVNN